ncbi:hypothetical protein [Devosia sp. RR2S18]|uniref:hypothetical protein n=1 Tax=Devosia rhizosphaerae TaxID=3049774 RepID=UPI0025404566|nr:hypothetical protein [Devosia sp. RR2S18]WIJ23541.1 hypothetical protein QOV41_10670 [Devosia sp. RR2S18]
MTTTLTRFKTAASALCIGMALAAATPVAAQESLSPTTGSDYARGSWGNGFGPRHWQHWNDGGWDRPEHGRRCLRDREVRRGIGDYGYRNVEIVGELRRDRVEVRAVKRNWLYSMRVDRCTGEVDRVERLRRMRGGYADSHGGLDLDGGFHLDFNFGN